MNDKSSVPEEESSEKRNSIKISNSILQRLEFGREIQYVTQRKGFIHMYILLCLLYVWLVNFAMNRKYYN